ncbi:MAG: hypothetical protein JWR37_5167, partial [Mycobacterium sp.]|nr:hypothetical protein [Mycobacterium sp.]
MLHRLKAAARRKLQAAVAEVVETELARSQQLLEDMHSENVAMLDRLSDRLSEVNDRLQQLEQHARRDMSYSLDIVAAGESAAFVLEHLLTVPVFWHPHDTLRFALGEVEGPGLAVEFGVAGGTTLAIIVDAVASDRRVVGFDTFTGLPETWRTGFPAGQFAQDAPPKIAGAQL